GFGEIGHELVGLPCRTSDGCRSCLRARCGIRDRRGIRERRGLGLVALVLRDVRRAGRGRGGTLVDSALGRRLVDRLVAGFARRVDGVVPVRAPGETEAALRVGRCHAWIPRRKVGASGRAGIVPAGLVWWSPLVVPPVYAGRTCACPVHRAVVLVQRSSAVAWSLDA